MKRRTFIWTAIASVAVITVPVISYKCRNSLPGDPMLRPDALSRFCDEDTIRAIGQHYMKLVPGEARKEKLVELLLMNEKGEKLKSRKSAAIENWIAQNVHSDFEAERIVTVNGWILSATESRQCALLSLS